VEKETALTWKNTATITLTAEECVLSIYRLWKQNNNSSGRAQNDNAAIFFPSPLVIPISIHTHTHQQLQWKNNTLLQMYIFQIRMENLAWHKEAVRVADFILRVNSFRSPSGVHNYCGKARCVRCSQLSGQLLAVNFDEKLVELK
jgi:hypothetical protein